ncbi:hypothetical protein P7K49_012229, partial [Saguinus oedipus]
MGDRASLRQAADSGKGQTQGPTWDSGLPSTDTGTRQATWEGSEKQRSREEPECMLAQGWQQRRGRPEGHGRGGVWTTPGRNLPWREQRGCEQSAAQYRQQGPSGSWEILGGRGPHKGRDMRRPCLGPGKTSSNPRQEGGTVWGQKPVPGWPPQEAHFVSQAGLCAAEAPQEGTGQGMETPANCN